MADYSKKEKLVEHAETHLDLLLKISALQEKSLQDETQSLELMKALSAKRMYESLQEDCSPGQFIDRAFKAAEVSWLRLAVARGPLPGLSPVLAKPCSHLAAEFLQSGHVLPTF